MHAHKFFSNDSIFLKNSFALASFQSCPARITFFLSGKEGEGKKGSPHRLFFFFQEWDWAFLTNVNNDISPAQYEFFSNGLQLIFFPSSKIFNRKKSENRQF